jgi:hypothetical protein
MSRKTTASDKKDLEASSGAIERKSRPRGGVPFSGKRRTAANGVNDMAENPIEEIAEASKRIATDVELFSLASDASAISDAANEIRSRLAAIDRLVDRGRKLWKTAERLEEDGAPEANLVRARGEWESNMNQAREAFRDVNQKRIELEHMLSTSAVSSSPPVSPLIPPDAQAIPFPLTPPPPAPSTPSAPSTPASASEPAPEPQAPMRPPRPGPGGRLLLPPR